MCIRDSLMSGRTVEGYQPYEDSLTAKVQGKLCLLYTSRCV